MTADEITAIMKRDMPGWKIVTPQEGQEMPGEKAVLEDMPAFKARYKLPEDEAFDLVWVDMASGPKAVILAQGRVIGFQG